MTLKEKLISLNIDPDKKKDLVEEIKNALNDAGENAKKVTNKLSTEGEKIVESFAVREREKQPKKQILRPKTIHSDEIGNKNEDVKETINPDKVEVQKKSDSSENKPSSVPFWNDLDNKNAKVKISIKGAEKRKPNFPANGRPLPQSTIDELKRKKQQEERSRQDKNPQDKKPFDKKPNANKPVVKSPNFAGKNVKTTFNAGNAALATGTNNRFEGKKKDKSKYARDYEGKKSQGKNVKNKQDKYKTTITNYDNEEVIRKKKKTGPGAFIKPEVRNEKPADEIKSITIPDVISVRDLASKLKMQPADIVKKLFLAGKMVTPNTELSYEEAENIAIDYEILCEKEAKVDVIAELLKENNENEDGMITRPPVVCVMGHVDHGKTSILDAIRKTNVTDKEAGGITQHIGAYQVNVKGRLITFLDTPGHEAFTAMRLRGAKSTDIAILVVAADDGVKPQTIEAINHAKAAGVEIIVAVNKIDKPDANVERVKQQLAEYEVISNDWGGKTTFCEVSAKKNLGIDNLLEMVLLTADVLDLKANPNRLARGIVIEGLLDKGKGPVARILVQKGTLHVGDFVAMGSSYGKVRAMTDSNGERVKDALPSMPVELLGLNSVPQAGDTFVCFENEKDARNFAETYVSENKKKLVEEQKQSVSLDQIFNQIKAGELKELSIVLKSDVVGSSEAIKNSLEKLSNDEVVVKVIHSGVGNINESDVTLASASKAIVIGFNVKPEPNTKSLIEKENVDIRLYSIIYNAIEDVEKAMKGLLAPVFVEKILGSVVVRQVFKASKVGNIAGCFVNDGEIRRNAKVRLKRGGKLLFDGNVISLKRFKDEAKEVKAGFECGVVLEDYTDYMPEDIMEVYIMEEQKDTNETK